MPYQYLDDIASADVAFKATGKSRAEMFVSAGNAVLQVMMENFASLNAQETKDIDIDADNEEMLLLKYLQEIIFLKDAEQLLLRASRVSIRREKRGTLSLCARLQGEKIDPARHHLNVDVKAVTMHRFRVQQTQDGWQAVVVLDI